MKKIIFLVDTNNSNFLIVNNKSRWELPTLSVNENSMDENLICERYQRKYRHPIRNICLIEKNNNFVFFKCQTDCNFIQEPQFKVGVINEIMPLIKNKFHNQLLLNLSIKIGNEMLNDSFWLGIILTVEDKIHDLTMKALLTDFLLFFSSSFCEEAVTYKFCGKNYKFDNKIKKMRKRYFKKCPLYNSKDIKIIIKEMGIDFDNYVFDNVLFYIDNELIDINSRTWFNRDKEEFGLYNAIILSPRRWIKNFCPQLNDFFENIRKPYVDKFVKEIDKKKITFKTYSSKKLFDNDLSNNEKIYIMQRIGLLKTIIYFSKVFKFGNYVIMNEEKNIIVSFDKFLLKVKAELIELLWNDNCQNNLPFLNNILMNYPSEISNDFFRINRKCRDNIHYGFYNELTFNEINILIDNQDLYLNYIITEFEKHLKIKFNIGYKISLVLAKIQYWSSK